jgi:hypothetical protein
MIAYVVALAFVLAFVLGMLALVVSVVVGAMSVGNLWVLLPLASYALVFWMLARLAKDTM